MSLPILKSGEYAIIVDDNSGHSLPPESKVKVIYAYSTSLGCVYECISPDLVYCAIVEEDLVSASINVSKRQAENIIITLENEFRENYS